jgi:dipeptidyl aminopeptidase/acylaminoacyl peptidase
VTVKARFGTVAAASLLAFAVSGAAPRAASPLPATLAFAKLEADGGGVFVWERSGRVRLFARAAQSPSWSPDGRRLAYVRDGELWVADSDGSHRARLSDHATAVDWAPDGRSLVVEREAALVVVRADGAGERVLTGGTEPAWSRTNRIAFVRDGDLHLIDPSGRGLRRLTTSAAIESEPAWAPDGRRLAYVSSDGAAIDLFVLDVAGGAVTQITADPVPEASPAWSADGVTIAFVANRTGADAAWTVAATGGTAASLPGVTRLTDLRWRPAISNELRPDLDQQAPSQLSIVESRGRFLLGFRSATDNVGHGALEIEAFRPTGLPTMRTVQRVRLAGGGSRVYRRVGFLRYTYSPSHDHWHLMGFQRYELRRADDHSLLLRDRKSGFCLTDRWGNAAAGFRGRRKRPVYTDYCARGNTKAQSLMQGTTVGYSDVYPAHFHGQNLNVTRLPAGIYTLVHRASPNLLVRELRYENNAASLRIRLRWPHGKSKKPAIRVLARCPATERCPP